MTNPITKANRASSPFLTKLMYSAPKQEPARDILSIAFNKEISSIKGQPVIEPVTIKAQGCIDNLEAFNRMLKLLPPIVTTPNAASAATTKLTKAEKQLISLPALSCKLRHTKSYSYYLEVYSSGQIVKLEGSAIDLEFIESLIKLINSLKRGLL